MDIMPLPASLAWCRHEINAIRVTIANFLFYELLNLNITNDSNCKPRNS